MSGRIVVRTPGRVNCHGVGVYFSVILSVSEISPGRVNCHGVGVYISVILSVSEISPGRVVFY